MDPVRSDILRVMPGVPSPLPPLSGAAGKGRPFMFLDGSLGLLDGVRGAGVGIVGGVWGGAVGRSHDDCCVFGL